MFNDNGSFLLALFEFFIFFAWIMCVFYVFADIFRSHDVTDTASCESLRLQLVELGLGDRSRVEELLGRRDLICARAATARGGD